MSKPHIQCQMIVLNLNGSENVKKDTQQLHNNNGGEDCGIKKCDLSRFLERIGNNAKVLSADEYFAVTNDNANCQNYRTTTTTTTSGHDSNDKFRCKEQWDRAQQDILKFIKDQDRWMALASMLLKSRAFHETYSFYGVDNINNNSPSCDLSKENDLHQRGDDGTGGTTTPIIVLPRTMHNKPYIPVRKGGGGENGDCIGEEQEEENMYPISISHQFPFVGVVRLMMVHPSLTLLPTTNPSTTDMPYNNSQMRVGYDIVMFDDVNDKLYDTVSDFCNVFRDSFTLTEWSSIMSPEEDTTNVGATTNKTDISDDNDDSRLRELYLRWAVKEAYTKALGVGMGYDFGTFETHLHELASSDQHHQQPCSSLWKWIQYTQQQNPTQQYFQSMGTVVQMPSSSSLSPASLRPHHHDSETWLYCFQPLYDDDDVKSNMVSEKRSSTAMRGCACVCLGPLVKADNVDLTIEWTTLPDLLTWHGIV